jgi:hypothetical protein
LPGNLHNACITGMARTVLLAEGCDLCVGETFGFRRLLCVKVPGLDRDLECYFTREGIAAADPGLKSKMNRAASGVIVASTLLQAKFNAA